MPSIKIGGDIYHISGGGGGSGVIETFRTVSRDRLKFGSLNSGNVIRKVPYGANTLLLFLQIQCYRAPSDQ